MRLQSHDAYDVVASFRPDSGEFVEMIRADADALLDQPLQGHFSWGLGPLAVLYCSGGLRLRLGELDRALDEVEVDWSVVRGFSRLQVTSPESVLRYEYPAPRLPEFDYTPFVELEHFDFGCFVSNVVADPERAARLYAEPLAESS